MKSSAFWWKMRRRISTGLTRLRYPGLPLADDFRVEGHVPAITISGPFRVGRSLYLRSPTRAIELNVGPNGSLSIGDYVLLNDGVSIRAEIGVSIGSHCLIAENVAIMDTHFHQIGEGEETRKRPVMIEDNVWIGRGSIILPGVHIGRNTVIGAGSVVTKSIPPNAVAVGVPARVTRLLHAGETFTRR